MRDVSEASISVGRRVSERMSSRKVEEKGKGLRYGRP